jgi:RimJ/RimL family protein N-acetyltransferase
MELTTERTIIRGFKADDFQDLYEYLSLPATYQYEPGMPITIDEAKKICTDRVGSNDFFAVELKLEHKLIGHISFIKSKPSYVNTFELGYIFNPNYQGRGFATESGKIFIKYVFENLKVHKIIANCNPAHKKSWKLLERVGMKREGRLEKNIYFKEHDGKPIWQDTFVYGLVNNVE